MALKSSKEANTHASKQAILTATALAGHLHRAGRVRVGTGRGTVLGAHQHLQAPGGAVRAHEEAGRLTAQCPKGMGTPKAGRSAVQRQFTEPSAVKGGGVVRVPGIGRVHVSFSRQGVSWRRVFESCGRIEP